MLLSCTSFHVTPRELHFAEPPEIIGQGGFGVVVLGQYRGTKVAVKRVLPPSTKALNSGSFEQSGSGSVDLLTDGTASMEAKKSKKKGKGKKADADVPENEKAVKFSSDSIDLETGKKSSMHRWHTLHPKHRPFHSLHNVLRWNLYRHNRRNRL